MTTAFTNTDHTVRILSDRGLVPDRVGVKARRMLRRLHTPGIPQPRAASCAGNGLELVWVDKDNGAQTAMVRVIVYRTAFYWQVRLPEEKYTGAGSPPPLARLKRSLTLLSAG